MRALLIVEREFLAHHVGVRRVILYYFRQLRASGWTVDFGAPISGQIFLGEFREGNVEARTSSCAQPSWSSSVRELRAAVARSRDEQPSIIWTQKQLTPDDYAVNVVTCPWVCAQGVPLMPRTVGIVYDLVPILLASCCLRFSKYLNIHEFAQQHDMGFRYYLANADRILCISDSTRADFARLYKTAAHVPSIVTDIPFKVTMPASEPGFGTILLVNALDWRKNLANIGPTLLEVAKKMPFRLRVIGRERIDQKDALTFLHQIADRGIDVEWYRDVDDTLLAKQYSEASVLFFPSLYEGLGLPILEAQQAGTPTLTSNTSSCPEINLNPDLCVDPSNVTEMARSLVGLLCGGTKPVTGHKLRELLVARLASKSNSVAVFDLHGTTPKH